MHAYSCQDVAGKRNRPTKGVNAERAYSTKRITHEGYNSSYNKADR